MEKYGFVYIWYDRKHKRFYIGAHWGSEDDKYICSSSWMMQAYKRRPEDFGKRKILKRIYTNKQDLFMEEYKWLSMIKPEELKKKYYNLSVHSPYHWSSNIDEVKNTRKKISNTRKSREQCRESSIANLKIATKKNIGKKRPEHSQLMKEYYKQGKLIVPRGHSTGHRTEEQKRKISIGAHNRPKVCCIVCHKPKDSLIHEGIWTCHFYNHHRNCI